MERRSWIKKIGLLSGAGAVPQFLKAEVSIEKPVLTIAHITDVHIRNFANAPNRFVACLNEIKKHNVGLFLNGGDSIHAADYENVSRASVLEQWGVWDNCMKVLSGYEIHSCIGNHDTWWAAPNKQDEMYGKPYVVKRLNMPHRYYSISKNGWHIFILDGNNVKISLDDEQMKWLSSELLQLPPKTPVLLMSHYPILGVTPILENGGHADAEALKDLFYLHKDKVKVCISGHQHLLDSCIYNGVHYYCNGSVSGFWWEQGDKQSSAPGYYKETPPGYAILKLYKNGRVENTYYPFPKI